MVIDYVYEITPEFAKWLAFNRPTVVSAFNQVGRQLVGFRVAVRVTLDKFMRPVSHALIFPAAPLSPEFDLMGGCDGPVLVLEAHPDEVSAQPPDCLAAAIADVGDTVFMPIYAAMKAGLRFVPLTIVDFDEAPVPEGICFASLGTDAGEIIAVVPGDFYKLKDIELVE